LPIEEDQKEPMLRVRAFMESLEKEWAGPAFDRNSEGSFQGETRLPLASW
jgi:hypothetical protein